MSAGQPAQVPWVEKYRPSTQEQIISHDKIKYQIQQFLQQNALPNLLFHGPAGVGKTTLIKVIARQLYGDNYQNFVVEINASDENGIEVVRERINSFVRTKTLLNNPIAQGQRQIKLIILDECDQMSAVAQGALRRIIELSSANARFCLICNYISKIIPPLQSRCAMFRFRPIDRPSCLSMLKDVCSREQVVYDEEALEAIYQITQGDMRQSINLLEAATMTTQGKLEQRTIYDVSARPSAQLAIQFMQPQTFQDRYEQMNEILLQGVSLEDFISVLLQQVIDDKSIDESVKIQLLIRMGEIDEGIQLGADVMTQMAGLVGAFGDM